MKRIFMIMYSYDFDDAEFINVEDVLLYLKEKCEDTKFTVQDITDYVAQLEEERVC